MNEVLDEDAAAAAALMVAESSAALGRGTVDTPFALTAGACAAEVGVAVADEETEEADKVPEEVDKVPVDVTLDCVDELDVILDCAADLDVKLDDKLDRDAFEEVALVDVETAEFVCENVVDIEEDLVTEVEATGLTDDEVTVEADKELVLGMEDADELAIEIAEEVTEEAEEDTELGKAIEVDAAEADDAVEATEVAGGVAEVVAPEAEDTTRAEEATETEEATEDTEATIEVDCVLIPDEEVATEVTAIVEEPTLLEVKVDLAEVVNCALLPEDDATEAEVACVTDAPEELDDAVVVSNATVHVLTSSNAGFPLLSVMGLRTITHVSVIGPASVLRVCTVFRDIAWRAESGRACTFPSRRSRQWKVIKRDSREYIIDRIGELAGLAALILT